MILGEIEKHPLTHEFDLLLANVDWPFTQLLMSLRSHENHKCAMAVPRWDDATDVDAIENVPFVLKSIPLPFTHADFMHKTDAKEAINMVADKVEASVIACLRGALALDHCGHPLDLLDVVVGLPLQVREWDQGFKALCCIVPRVRPELCMPRQ